MCVYLIRRLVAASATSPTPHLFECCIMRITLSDPTAVGFTQGSVTGKCPANKQIRVPISHRCACDGLLINARDGQNVQEPPRANNQASKGACIRITAIQATLLLLTANHMPRLAPHSPDSRLLCERIAGCQAPSLELARKGNKEATSFPRCAIFEV